MGPGLLMQKYLEYPRRNEPRPKRPTKMVSGRFGLGSFWIRVVSAMGHFGQVISAWVVSA